jgi:hypothetical protein
MAMPDLPVGMFDYAAKVAAELSKKERVEDEWLSDVVTVDGSERFKGYVLKVIVMTKEQYLSEESGEDEQESID